MQKNPTANLKIGPFICIVPSPPLRSWGLSLMDLSSFVDLDKFPFSNRPLWLAVFPPTRFADRFVFSCGICFQTIFFILTSKTHVQFPWTTCMTVHRLLFGELKITSGYFEVADEQVYKNWEETRSNLKGLWERHVSFYMELGEWCHSHR